MLSFTRKIGEAIRIGDAKLVVLDSWQGKVRLGIEAPKEIPVHRQEVYEAIKRETDDDS